MLPPHSEFPLPQHMPPPTFLRDTVKTRASSSASTYFEDHPRFGSGATSHSRPTHRRHTRQHMADSHVRTSTHPPPKHHILPSRYPQQSTSPNKRLPASPQPSPDRNPYIGRLSKDLFVKLTSDALNNQATRNAGVELPTYSEPESVFFSVSRPDIPTEDYIRRLVTYTQCSPAAFVLMLVYLDRIADANSRLHVTPYNMHRLLVTALTLACKVLDDRCFSNVHYAKVGGIPTAREMNRLELQFLSYLNYRLHVTPETYEDKLMSLQTLISTPFSVQEFIPISSPVTASSSLDVDEFRSVTSSVTCSTTSSSVSYSEPHVNNRTRPELNQLVHSQSYPLVAHSTAPLEKTSSWNAGSTQRVDKRSRYNERRHRADFAAQRMITDL